MGYLHTLSQELRAEVGSLAEVASSHPSGEDWTRKGSSSYCD